MKARFIEYLDASFSVRLVVNSQNGMPWKIGPNSEKQCFRLQYTPSKCSKGSRRGYQFRTSPSEYLSLSMSTQAEKQRPAEEAHLGILGESICILICESCRWGPAGGQRPA